MAEFESPDLPFKDIINGLSPEQLASCWKNGVLVVERVLTLAFGEEVKSLKNLDEEAGYAPNSLRAFRSKQDLPVIRVQMEEDTENTMLFMRKSDLAAYQSESKQGRGRKRRQTR